MTVSLLPAPRSITWPDRLKPILTKSLADPVSVVNGLAAAPKKSRLSEMSTGFAELPEAIRRLVLVNCTTSMFVRVSVPSRPAV
jgi:hypothetical protein